jgi:hypothetical protein
VIESWRSQAPTDFSATVALQAGTRTDIRVEYFQGSQGANAQLFWQRADDPLAKRQIVPTNMLYPALPNAAAANAR